MRHGHTAPMLRYWCQTSPSMSQPKFERHKHCTILWFYDLHCRWRDFLHLVPLCIMSYCFVLYMRWAESSFPMLARRNFKQTTRLSGSALMWAGILFFIFQVRPSRVFFVLATWGRACEGSHTTGHWLEYGPATVLSGRDLSPFSDFMNLRCAIWYFRAAKFSTFAFAEVLLPKHTIIYLYLLSEP